MIVEFDRYVNELRNTADFLGVRFLADEVLGNNSFLTQSGCLPTVGHHHGIGGLLKHTWEVVRIAMMMADFYKDAHDIDLAELFLSALFHDYGKIWDYDYDEASKKFIDAKSKHRRRIHHIQRSTIEWEKIAAKHKLGVEFTERVSHNILAHHGQREWGSAVAPYSREAWILHLSDSMSARVDDCDRLDMLTVNKRNK